MSQTKTDKPKGAIVQDAEIQALNSCNKALAKLTGEEQVRIVMYLKAKYLDPKLPPSTKHPDFAESAQ